VNRLTDFGALAPVLAGYGEMMPNYDASDPSSEYDDTLDIWGDFISPEHETNLQARIIAEIDAATNRYGE
jgi:hypothetical protein